MVKRWQKVVDLRFMPVLVPNQISATRLSDYVATLQDLRYPPTEWSAWRMVRLVTN